MTARQYVSYKKLIGYTKYELVAGFRSSQFVSELCVTQ